MILLALESSTSLTSVALLTPQGIRLREEDSSEHKASDSMMAMIEVLLTEQGLHKSALQLIAYGSGPGAFTGLRTACAVAQGIAFGLQLPTLGVTSMQALAEQAYEASQATQVMAVMDARMNEVYAQALQRDAMGQWQTQTAIAVTAIENIPWPDNISNQTSWQGAGNAWHSTELGVPMHAATPAQVKAPAKSDVPHAAAIAKLALQQVLHKDLHADLLSMMAEPLYVRDRVAQTTAERMAAKAGAAP